MNRFEIIAELQRLLATHRGCPHSKHYLSMIGEVPVIQHEPAPKGIGVVLRKLSKTDINEGMTSSQWYRLVNNASNEKETKK